MAKSPEEAGTRVGRAACVRINRFCAGAVFVLAIVGNGLMAWTANLGGQISHPEIRSEQTVALDAASIEHDGD